jgi:hypothetical protein
MVLYFCVFIVFSLRQESLKLFLVDEPLPEVLLSQCQLCTPITCLQLAGRNGAQGYPKNPSSPVPRSRISKDPGIDITSFQEASQGELEPVPLRDLGAKHAS